MKLSDELKKGKMIEFPFKEIPSGHVVYQLSFNKRSVYVGQTKNLLRRLVEHLYSKKLFDQVRYTYIKKRDAVKNENFLISKLNPTLQKDYYLDYMKENEIITPGNLAKEFNVSGAAVTSWLQPRIENGILTWCNEDGTKFSNEKELKTAKHRGKAFLKFVKEKQ